MAKITLCLLTYARTDYAIETLKSTLENIMWAGDLHVHIADDGSEGPHRDKLFYCAQEYMHHSRITISNSERGGYGRNYNLATQAIHDFSDYILVLEDDWEITHKLDLDMLVRALDSSIGIECIRLGYMSFTQALFGRVMSAPPNWEKYLLLDPTSPEPHVFAGHPRLESVAYQKRVGLWPEGLSPGQTEFVVAHNPEARQGVAWPMFFDPTIGCFRHIGAIRSTDIAEPVVTV